METVRQDTSVLHRLEADGTVHVIQRSYALDAFPFHNIGLVWRHAYVEKEGRA